MARAAIVVLASTDTHADTGRLVNALETAREFAETDGDEAAVCEYCAGAFGVTESVADAGLETLDDHDGHPSIRALVEEDYEVITF